MLRLYGDIYEKGPRAPFLMGFCNMLAKRIHHLIEPVIQSLGLMLWANELHVQGQYSLLRIYIDRTDGQPVTIEDCSKVSREVGAILDVEDVIKNHYQLEVSSPGLDRVLLTPEHFARYLGSQAKVRLRAPKLKSRKFIGRIEKIEGENIVFDVENERVSVAINEIQKANLVG